MPRHAIHLGTAWEQPTAATPAWVRRFGRPAGVGDADRLLLVCEGVDLPGPWRAATLNERSLDWATTGSKSLECDVTALVLARNLLLVPVDADGVADRGRPASRSATPEAWGRLSLVIVSD